MQRSMRGGPALVGSATAEEPARPAGPTGPRTSRPDCSWASTKGPSSGVLVVTASGRRAVSRRARIDCCYVEEDARGVGVGTALMDAAVALV